MTNKKILSKKTYKRSKKNPLQASARDDVEFSNEERIDQNPVEETRFLTGRNRQK